MFSNISLALLTVVIVFQFMMLPLSARSAITAPQVKPLEPHDFRAYGMDCRSCHTSLGLKTGGMVKPVTEICVGCHNIAVYQSHPVDIKPSFAMPAGLPLSEEGMMTCATCHDPHKTYRNVLSGEKTMYLRREGPKKLFCMACHSKA